MSDLLSLADRRVVVAGAGGGGIGTAIARILAEAGASVAAVDVDAAKLPEVEAALAHTAGSHLMLTADLQDPVQVDRVVEDATKSGPPLYGLVQVAGGQFADQWGPIALTEPSVAADVVRLNFTAAMLTARAVHRRLADAGNGGSIVAIASVAGLLSMPYGFAYSASKAALMSFVRTAAVEWGPEHIRVNAVAPGTIRTPKAEAGLPPAPDTPAEKAAIPLGRRGQSDDIAKAVLFFLSDLAEWVTGQTLAVDGGNSIRPSFLDDQNLPVFVHEPAVRDKIRGL
jgi:3-oxoacyl-[acyl-carrier protein] reductase